MSAFLSGYLHQDFLVEHRTPGAALRAFVADASAAERRALRMDWSVFLASIEQVSWRDAREAFVALGGAWLPPSRRALRGLFAGL